MRNLYLLFLIIVLGMPTISCNSKDKKELIAKNNEIAFQKSNIPVDSLTIKSFFKSYPKVQLYETDVFELYQKHQYNQIWYDDKGIIELGNTLYSRFKELDKEGVVAIFPYESIIDSIFEETVDTKLSQTDSELLITTLYIFYAEKVVKGIDEETSKSLEWLLPRKQISYTSLLDSIMLHPDDISKQKKVLFNQYYKLRDVLQKYREIEKKGGWVNVEVNADFKVFKPGDSAVAIRQIKDRLFTTGELKQNNQSTTYDNELVEAIQKFQQQNGKNPTDKIELSTIKLLNISVTERIKKILVNMERCRWLSPEMVKANEYVVVNIPSYKLFFVRNGKQELVSPVVVGKAMNKTVIFSGTMSYIVFSPYWNVPTSIIKKEIKPAMAKNKNYLASHNMEWNNGNIRQKPGKNNSLGLVKFIFPNSNNIYLHDTPAKSLFEKETRAFSHGCIRVGKARDLALTILKDDPNWTTEKIDAAMNSGKENWYTLKNKIPVYIGYFTAWVNANGEINFYDDIYERDERLLKLIYTE